MKKLSFFILPFLISCNLHVAHENTSPGKLEFSAELGGWSQCDTNRLVFIKTRLYNNTKDTVTYLRMTCSWGDSYTTDNDSFPTIKIPCYSNGPLTVKLAPYKSEEEYLTIITKVPLARWREHYFRVGFNFAALDTTKDLLYNVSRLTDMKSIMWSDTLRLRSFWKEY
jgi:hypothetical protein